MAHSFGKVSCKEHPPCSAHSGDSKSGLHVSNNMVVWASLVRDATRLLSLKSVGSQLGQSRCLSFFLLSVLLCSWRMISEVLCQRMMVSILWGVYWHQPDVVACNCSCSHICWGCQCIFLRSFQWLLWVLWHTHELSSLVPTLKTFIFKLHVYVHEYSCPWIPGKGFASPEAGVTCACESPTSARHWTWVFQKSTSCP